MMNSKPLLTAIFLLTILLTKAQEIKLVESEVPANVIVGHFTKFSDSSVQQWSEFIQDGSKQYAATFEYKGRLRKNIYTPSGKLILERQSKDQIPSALIAYLDMEYDKFKVLNFVFIRDFEKELASYEVMIKTKDDGILTIPFDDQLKPADPYNQVALKE